RLQATNNLRHRHLPHSPTKEAQVEHHRHAEEQTQRPHVKRFDDGISNLRFMERDAPRRFRQLLEETQKRHSHPVELPSRVRRNRGKLMVSALPSPSLSRPMIPAGGLGARTSADDYWDGRDKPARP